MNKRWYKLKRNRVIAGVIGGLAWSSGLQPLWLRGGFVLLIFSGAIVPPFFVLLTLAYIAAIFILPEVPPALEPEIKPLIEGLVRPVNQRLLAGVCAGLAKYYKLDLNLVRFATVLLSIFGGIGIVAYAVAWLIMPSVGKELNE